MVQIEKKIYEMMKEYNIMGEVVDYSDKKRMVAVEVIWGDWKHEHWKLDCMVRECFPDLRSIHEVTTEENGSDCYSAIHYYYFG